MARRRILGPLALLVLTAAGLFSPLSPTRVSSAADGGPLLSPDGKLYLQVRGTADREAGGPPDRFVYVLDVYDMANRKVGKVRHDVKFTSPSTLDLVSTFSLPDGELVNHGVEAIGPDASKQGFYLIGVHSDTDTVQGGKSTGAYAGRTGRLRMSGWHDANKFPQTVTLNDFYEITFNS
ncbi:MAG TPA: hypothetical protein VFS16_12060 [Acidimicrobiia bacterium]|nr:hypothetical protein [Acidimicrobiia bacterium]